MNRMLLSVLMSFLMVSPELAFAHAGHDKTPGEDEAAPGGPITITREAKTNLGLTVAEAEVRQIQKTLTVIGEIESIPSKTTAVTSRIPGRVSQIYFTDGQKVKKDMPLVEVESRQLGDPPPRVKYASQINGTVMDRHVQLGDTVEPEKHLVEVVDLSEVYAEGRIYEGQISELKMGQQVRVYVDSYPTEVFLGFIDAISGALDKESRTLRVWAKVKNSEEKLRPGMRARLSIVVNKSDAVIAVPHSAVLGEEGNLFVFVQSETDELMYEKRLVVTGIKDDRYIEAIEGVLPGDKVVTIGNYQLQYVPGKKKDEKKEEEGH